jgi:hypothetical protein
VYLLSVAWIRDLVVVMAGLVYVVLAIIQLAIIVAIFWFGRKGVVAVRRVWKKRAPEQIGRVQTIAGQIQERTARLPGAPGSEAGASEIITGAQAIRDMDPPFRRTVKSWRPF